MKIFLQFISVVLFIMVFLLSPLVQPVEAPILRPLRDKLAIPSVKETERGRITFGDGEHGWWSQLPPTSYGYGPYGYGLPYGFGYWPEVYGTYGYGPLLGPAPYMFSTLLRPLEWVSPYEVPAPDDMGSEFLTDLKEIKADVEELKMGLDKLLEMKAKKSSRTQQGRVLLDSDSNEQKAESDPGITLLE